MKILLINPYIESTVKESALDLPFIMQKTSAYTAPLALATIAALTPSGHEMYIHDEAMRGPVEPVLEEDVYDIIGISLISKQITRVLSILALCRHKELAAHLVLGGPGITSIPAGCGHLIDTVFIGEAEETWPRFLDDLKRGVRKPLYQQLSKPALDTSPPPCWDSIASDLKHYKLGAVQTTRGCPFDCIYCNVPYIYGRRPRSKPINNVLEEIRTLESLGVKSVFITDDNFCAHKRYTKELLKEIIAFNNTLAMPIGFLAQADITISRDEELLQLMADANVLGVMEGIESINQNSLQDLNKQQNLNVNLIEGVRKIQSYGIAVFAGIIFGSDSDDPGIFKQTADFLKEANIVAHASSPLNAPVGTRLWYQLKRERRLVNIDDKLNDQLDAVIMTNIIPKQMSRIELMEELASYWETVVNPLHYMERALGFIKNIAHRRNVKQPHLRILLPYMKIMLSVLWFFAFQAAPKHRRAFFTILKAARSKGRYLMAQMTFLYITFMIEHKRSLLAARLLREQAAREKTRPEEIILADESVPIPGNIRENAAKIFFNAYACVRPHISDRELLYQTVAKAMADYIEIHGASFERLDEYHRRFIKEHCDRAIALMATDQPKRALDIAEEEIPFGFEREMIDALDCLLRVRECIAPKRI